MTNNTLINAAIAEANKNLRALYPEDAERLLDEAYASRGLTRRPRLSKAEKEARDAAEKRAKAEAKIFALAKENGLEVVVADEGTNLTPALAEVAIKAVREPQVTAPDPRTAEDKPLLDAFDEADREAEQRFQEALGGGQPPTLTTLVIE